MTFTNENQKRIKLICIILIKNKMSLNLLLLTTKATHKYTEGVLFDKDRNIKLYDTLEDTIRDINDNGIFDNGEKKIYGKTAILSGIFDIEVHFSNHFQKDVVWIKGTPNFTWIYLHYGHDESNTLGCLLVGAKIKDGKLKNVGATDELVRLLKLNGGSGTIEIVRS